MDVEGCQSEWEEVVSSVLQGTVLGGLMFNVFIDDIDDVVELFVRKFADDTKLAKIVESETDALGLQKDIDALAAWAQKWEMSFNIKKCKVMHVGRRNLRHRYVMGGIELEKVRQEKDLGIWTEESMKPAVQCEYAAKKVLPP